jgi:hypothetical protein
VAIRVNSANYWESGPKEEIDALFPDQKNKIVISEPFDDLARE